MTPEAALAKLAYVLGKDEWNLAKKKKVIYCLFKEVLWKVWLIIVSDGEEEFTWRIDCRKTSAKLITHIRQ